MTEEQITIIKEWILTKGKLPKDKSELFLIDENKEFLPVGKFTYSMPTDETISNILKEWHNEFQPILSKAIYVDEHYAFCPLAFTDTNITFIATFRE